jgi:hypothetical protein
MSRSAAALLVPALLALAAGRGDGEGGGAAPSAETARAGASAIGLDPLPPGPPALRCGVLVERVTLAASVARAEVVFVGSVLAVGGNEDAGAPGRRGSLPRYRARLEIRETLRGSLAPTVDVSALACNHILFDEGRSYLVFAERRRLGERRVRALVPVGYHQGVFRVSRDGGAWNASHGAVDLEDVARRVRVGSPTG